ncbi:hypothetical protein [Paenibacillus soyae]|uniref:Uncharacterized protein n=1 Tax=Paenibacillus soyae TaxID=2969249 RepID=A0A9X2S7G4_9BACL|nr:hypothetical protein [Paenibacillus soyae]MCR2803045.1 hypothetical protein [Paenibacillus soyae]
MKWSGILVGGVIGAAATLYFSRKRPGAVAWAASAMSDVAGKSVARMLSASSGLKREAADLAPKHTDDTAANSAAAWERIEAIVESDPAVKQEVNKIRAESSNISH